MSSPITQIRSLIQDMPLYYADTFVGDGVTKAFQLKYFPVVAASVMIAVGVPGPFTVTDAQNGIISFAVAPAVGLYGVNYTHTLLSDSVIQDMMDVENTDPSGGGDSEDVRIVAADCLDAIASQQALILKRIKLLDLDVDGPALAKALQAHAKSLRELVYSQQQNESTFDIAEQINDRAGWREKIIKDWMREQP